MRNSTGNNYQEQIIEKVKEPYNQPQKPYFRSSEGDMPEELILSGLALIVILISLWIDMNPDGDLIARLPFSGKEILLPGLCWFKTITGFPCPGCGLTRSFVAMGHMNPVGSFGYNPAGPVLFLLFMAQVPYRPIRMIFSRRHPLIFSTADRIGNRALILAVVLMAVFWLYKIGPALLLKLLQGCNH